MVKEYNLWLLNEAYYGNTSSTFMIITKKSELILLGMKEMEEFSSAAIVSFLRH